MYGCTTIAVRRVHLCLTSRTQVKHVCLQLIKSNNIVSQNKFVVFIQKIMSVCPSDEYQRLNYRTDSAQTAYRCHVGPGDGFRLCPIPIGC